MKDRSRWILAADGCLLTSATFALFTAAGVILDLAMGVKLTPEGPQGGSELMSALTGLFAMLGIVIGPILAWVLHNHRITGFSIIGGLIGYVAGGVVVGLATLAAMLLGIIVKLFTSNELLGPIIVLAILALIFLAAFIFLVIDAVRNLLAKKRDSVRLSVARLIAACIIIVFACGAFVYMLTIEDAFDAEVFVFVLAFGLAGAVAVATADIVVKAREKKLAS